MRTCVWLTPLFAMACSLGHIDRHIDDDAALDAPSVPDGSEDGTSDATADTDALQLGESCGAHANCASGYCTDGVCCNSACRDACESCRAEHTGVADGVCSAIARDTDPDDECDGLGCRGDFCDGARSCQPKAAGTVCRNAAGACDTEEACTGSLDCPPDAFRPSGTSCRASAGDCDVAEVCHGDSALCPTNSFAPTTTVCRAAVDVCDRPESCSGGSAHCPGDTYLEGTTCRASAGVCDTAELCNGEAPGCPVDQFTPATVVCRTATQACDRQELCTGTSAACPADVLQPPEHVCRIAAGPCDSEETCSGGSPLCPVDEVLPASTVASCAPFYCSGNTAACDTTCTTHSECNGGALCHLGRCSSSHGKRIFLTSTSYEAIGFGSLSGADLRCAQHAAAVGLPGTFRAWLSISSQSVASRFTHSTEPYFSLDSAGIVRIVANNFDDLIDGTLNMPIGAFSENGSATHRNFWTGTNQNGTSSNNNCDDWIGFGTFGRFGNATASDGSWTSAASGPCDQFPLPLLCVEQ